MSEQGGAVQFEALIRRVGGEFAATYVYVEAEDEVDAWNKVAEQRPFDYYTVWVQPKPDFGRAT